MTSRSKTISFHSLNPAPLGSLLFSGFLNVTLSSVISRAKGAFLLLLLFNLKKLEKDQFEIKVANRPEATNFRNKTPNGQK